MVLSKEQIRKVRHALISKYSRQHKSIKEYKEDFADELKQKLIEAENEAKTLDSPVNKILEDEELDENERLANEVLLAIFEQENKPIPNFANYKLLAEKDPDDWQEKAPMISRDRTAPRTIVFNYDERDNFCHDCHQLLSRCVCAKNNKSTYQVW